MVFLGCLFLGSMVGIYVYDIFMFMIYYYYCLISLIEKCIFVLFLCKSRAWNNFLAKKNSIDYQVVTKKFITFSQG